MNEEIKINGKDNPGVTEEKAPGDPAEEETSSGSGAAEGPDEEGKDREGSARADAGKRAAGEEAAGKREESGSEGSGSAVADEADGDPENSKDAEGVRDKGKEPRKVRKLEAKIAELEKKLAASEAASAEKDGKYLLLYAEYDNFRRRSQKEKEGIWTDAYSDAVQKLLPVLDNLYRAVDSGCTDPATVTEGLRLTLKSYEDALKQMGVEEIPALGETFNPELHSAVMHVDDESFGEGEIVEVFGKGYQRGGRVIRHSIVKVAN